MNPHLCLLLYKPLEENLLNTIWLVVSTPLKILVSWDYYSQLNRKK